MARGESKGLLLGRRVSAETDMDLLSPSLTPKMEAEVRKMLTNPHRANKFVFENRESLQDAPAVAMLMDHLVRDEVDQLIARKNLKEEERGWLEAEVRRTFFIAEYPDLNRAIYQSPLTQYGAERLADCNVTKDDDLLKAWVKGEIKDNRAKKHIFNAVCDDAYTQIGWMYSSLRLHSMVSKYVARDTNSLRLHLWKRPLTFEERVNTDLDADNSAVCGVKAKLDLCGSSVWYNAKRHPHPLAGKMGSNSYERCQQCEEISASEKVEFEEWRDAWSGANFATSKESQQAINQAVRDHVSQTTSSWKQTVPRHTQPPGRDSLDLALTQSDALVTVIADDLSLRSPDPFASFQKPGLLDRLSLREKRQLIREMIRTRSAASVDVREIIDRF